MAKSKQLTPSSLTELLAFEEAIDRDICGIPLDDEGETRFADKGAHDPNATYYFVLEDLFSRVAFDDDTRLLDVGCGKGRVLAHFVRQGYPGRATGVELDPELAEVAAGWTSRYDNLNVVNASVLDLELDRYTDFYLFNPFSQGVLQAFIKSVEEKLAHPATVIHMSDNGDTWNYIGRAGWTQLDLGTIQHGRNARGYPFKVYDCPQHYTIWRYEPIA